MQVEAEVSDIPVNAVSLTAFISREPLVARLDERIAAMRGVPLAEPGKAGVERGWSLANAAGLTTLQILRDALRKHETDVLEYFGQCLQVWGPPQQGSMMPRGVCIYHLAMMLLAAQGEDKVLEAMEAAGLRYSLTEVRRQVAITRDVLAKHPR